MELVRKMGGSKVSNSPVLQPPAEANDFEREEEQPMPEPKKQPTKSRADDEFWNSQDEKQGPNTDLGDMSIFLILNIKK